MSPDFERGGKSGHSEGLPEFAEYGISRPDYRRGWEVPAGLRRVLALKWLSHGRVGPSL